jgi:HK97 family phage prohead protease
VQTCSPIIEFKRATIADEGTFEGLGAVFHNVDLGGDRIVPGAFAATLEAYKREDSRPAMLWSHDPAEPLGAWIDLHETKEGLAVRGQLAMDAPRARSAHSLMKIDALGMSIGYKATDFDYDRDGVRELKRLDLYEVSLVSMPMNRRARVTSVKTLGDVRHNIRDFELALREQLCFSPREAKALATAHRLLRGNDQPTELDELLAEMRATLRE